LNTRPTCPTNVHFGQQWNRVGFPAGGEAGRRAAHTGFSRDRFLVSYLSLFYCPFAMRFSLGSRLKSPYPIYRRCTSRESLNGLATNWPGAGRILKPRRSPGRRRGGRIESLPHPACRGDRPWLSAPQADAGSRKWRRRAPRAMEHPLTPWSSPSH
jgi:hypothetical protein